MLDDFLWTLWRVVQVELILSVQFLLAVGVGAWLKSRTKETR